MKKTVVAFVTLIFVTVIAAIVFWAFSYSDDFQVNVTGMQLATLRSSISTNGKVEAEKVYELHAPFRGTIRTIEVHAGDSFKAGQPIVTIYDPALQSEITSARAELDAAEVELEKLSRGPSKEELDQASAEIARLGLELNNARSTLGTNEWLMQRGALSRSDLDRSSNEVKRLQLLLDAAVTRKDNIEKRFTDGDTKRATSRVEAARDRLRLLADNQERSVIRAPANGILYHFDLKPGAYLAPGDSIGLFADLSHLRVRAFVDEPDLGHVVEGAEVEIRWDARPQELWKGSVLHIPPEVVTRGTRSVAEVVCSISTPRLGLLPNVSVDVEIMTSPGPKVPTLPRSAVFTEGKDHYVWTILNGMATKRSVDTGRGTASLIEVTGGLSNNDRVIIPGEVPITEGMKVQAAGK
jgi:HlyD family secretion protein